MVEPMQATRVPDTGTPTFVIEEADDTLVRWYPLRIRFSNPKRAMQVRDELRRQDVTTYLHMEHQEVAHDDQLQHEMLPAVNNLIFVHAMKGRVKLLKRQNQICQHLQFIAKPALDNPERSEIIYVPDRQMENFIKAETLPDPYQQRIALTWSDFLGQEHRRVRIMQGPSWASKAKSSASAITASSLHSSARRRSLWASPMSLLLRWSSSNPYPQDPRPIRRDNDILL